MVYGVSIINHKILDLLNKSPLIFFISFDSSAIKKKDLLKSLKEMDISLNFVNSRDFRTLTDYSQNFKQLGGICAGGFYLLVPHVVPEMQYQISFLNKLINLFKNYNLLIYGYKWNFLFYTYNELLKLPTTNVLQNCNRLIINIMQQFFFSFKILHSSIRKNVPNITYSENLYVYY